VTRVLVTDGDERAGLATTRALARNGYDVIVCASRRPSLAGSSSECIGEVPVGDPLTTPDAYVASVARAVRQFGIRVIMPITEASLVALLPHRDRLSPAVVPWPALERFEAISDKVKVTAAAQDLGVPVPESLNLAGPDDRSAIDRAGRDLGWPVIAKPHRSVVGQPDARWKTRIALAASGQELRDVVSSMPAGAFPLLLQRRVEGPGIGVFLFRSRGRTLATFAHRRIREKPPSGGVSVLRESIQPNPDLVKDSERLLDAFDWDGVAMVEYKLNTATGTPVLMEVNARLWGSLQLAIDAGIDFPTLMVRLALGLGCPSRQSYKVGVRTRWMLGDLDHLLIQIRSGGGWTHVRRFLEGFGPGIHQEVFAWRDPVPWLLEVGDWLRPFLRIIP